MPQSHAEKTGEGKGNMSDNKNAMKYDLEQRTLSFARKTRILVRKLPRTISNIEDSKQLVRSSGSIGANYIEANWSLGKKDFAHKIRICRKEARESRYLLELINIDDNVSLEKEANFLKQETTELMKIFAAILQKVSGQK